MSPPPRRLIVVSILVFHLSGCVTWQRPNTSLVPGSYVAAEEPGEILVLTKSGERVLLRNPLVAGDSLVAGQATDTVWDDAPVALARAGVADIMIVKGDERDIEIVEVLTRGGHAVQVHRPSFGADSVTGVVPAPRAHRRGIPLADISQIRVKRVDVVYTTLMAVVGATAITMSAIAIAFWAEFN